MHVDLLIDSLGSGGAQRQFVFLADKLAEHGHQVQIRFYHKSGFYQPSNSEISCGILPGDSALMRKAAALYYTASCQREVMISFLDIPNLMNCLGSLFKPKVKRIVSERSVDTGNLGIRRRMIQRAYVLADTIVTNSETQLNALRQYGHGAKSVLIRNMVDTERFRPSERPHGDVPLKGICLASYQTLKNPMLAVRWLLTNRDAPVELHWYGNSSTGMLRSNFENARRASRDTHGKIHFHPTPVDAAEAYGTADFVFLPSFYEGFPNVICEAMACGLPVLCSRVSDNPSIVIDGVNGFLFDPYDPGSFGTAIGKLLCLSSHERSRMGARNTARARELFAPHRFAEDWINVLTK